MTNSAPTGMIRLIGRAHWPRSAVSVGPVEMIFLFSWFILLGVPHLFPHPKATYPDAGGRGSTTNRGKYYVQRCARVGSRARY